MTDMVDVGLGLALIALAIPLFHGDDTPANARLRSLLALSMIGTLLWRAWA